MKQILVMIAVVGCSKDTPEAFQAAEAEAQVASKPSPMPDPVPPVDEKVIAVTDPIVEKAIRESLLEPTGELTKADLEKVTRLRLQITKITDAGLKEVAKLQQLENLYLNGTKITDVGLKDVAKMKQLEGLWLDDTKVTKAGVAELKKALPKCLIIGL